MIEISKKPHFGDVYEISRDEFISQVTNAPKEAFVVLHLYQTYIENCSLINSFFEKLAVKFPLVKFVKIIATKCIENFADYLCPCFIIYNSGKLVCTLNNIDKMLSYKISLETLQKLLISQGVLPKSEDKEVEEINKLKPFISPIPQKAQNKEDLSDEEDDRGYSTFNLKKPF